MHAIDKISTYFGLLCLSELYLIVDMLDQMSCQCTFLISISITSTDLPVKSSRHGPSSWLYTSLICSSIAFWANYFDNRSINSHWLQISRHPHLIVTLACQRLIFHRKPKTGHWYECSLKSICTPTRWMEWCLKSSYIFCSFCILKDI